MGATAMATRADFQYVLAAGAIFLHAGLLSADTVKLDGGGSLSGSVTTGAKSVAVRTLTGGLIVFDRAEVKQVTHGHAGAAKKAPANANVKAQPKKRKLAPEEEAWMPKIRVLVSRLYGSDREKSQQAKNRLLNIDDPDAIPALSTHLGSSRDDEARHLYVVILHNMKGPKPVYYLVALSLYDSSPQIRSEARKAIREDQLDSARLLCIAALRSGPPSLARVAAVSLGEIGDPRGDSIPYLINALVSYGTVATMTEPAQYGVLYNVTIYATPGLKLNDPSLINAGQVTGSSTLPVVLASGSPNAEAAALLRRGEQVLTGTLYDPALFRFGGQLARDFTPNSKGMPEVAAMDHGTFLVTPVVADKYEQPIVGQVCAPRDKKIRGLVDHPEVLDALLKITDQKHPGYGFNQDQWRSWWANEKTNRDLQKPAKPDRVTSAGGTAN
jgi:hypothetical protein